MAKYDVIKTYGVEITAVTDKATEQINILEKELDELSKKKGLSAGLQSQIDKIGESLNGLKGEIVSSTKSINENLGKIDTDRMSKEFKDMQASIETSINGVQDKMKELQSSLDFLNDPNAGKGFAAGIGKMFDELSSTITGVVSQFADVSTLVQNIMDGSFDASSFQKLGNGIKDSSNKVSTELDKLVDNFKESIKQFNKIKKDGSLQLAIDMDVSMEDDDIKHVREIVENVFDNMNKIAKAEGGNAIDINSILFKSGLDKSFLKEKRKEIKATVDELVGEVEQAERKQSKDPTEVRFRYVIEDPDNTAINTIVEKIQREVITNVEKKLENSPIRIPIGYTYDKSMFKDDALAADKALGKDTEKVLFDSINLKIKADSSDLVNNINKEVENINAKLKTDGKKIEVEVVGKIDESTVEQSAKELSEEIEHQQFVNQNEFNLKGGNLTIDPSSGIATETTLSDIKTILSEWNSTGIPGTQSEEFKKSVEQEQKAVDNVYNVEQLLRTRKRGEVLQNKKDIIATTEYLVKSLERDQLIEQEIKKLKSNKKLKSGDKSVLAESAYYNEYTEVDGIKYAKFGHGETLEKWQEKLSSLFDEGGLFPSEKEIKGVKKKFKGYFQDEINRIDKSMKSTRESLASNGVEYAKDKKGKYTNEILYSKGTISSTDDNVYEKVQATTNIIKNDAIESLKHFHEVKEELIEQRQIMQEIVVLSNKVEDGSATDEDKSRLDYLKQDLQERTKIISDQKRYNELKEEEIGLVNKNIEKGLNATENKRLLEIRTEMDSLFKNASDDMVEYSKEQTRVIKNDLSSIDISIKEIIKKESALRRVTKDAINDILDDNFERIRSDSHYEYNKKEIEKLSKENSRLSKMISTKTDSYTGKTSYDYSAMTQAEKDKYWSNEKRLKFLRTQNHIYEEQRSIQEDTLEIAKKEEKVRYNIAKNLNVPKKDKKAYNTLFNDKSAKDIINDRDYIKSLSDDALKDAQSAVAQVQNAINNSTEKSEEEIVQAAKKMIKADIKALQELLKIRQESYDRHVKEKDFKAAKHDQKEMEKIRGSISSLQDPKSEVNAALLKEQAVYREKIYEYNHANYQLEEKVQALDEESKKKLKDILKINEAIAENEHEIAKINSTQNVNDSAEEVAKIEKERKVYEDKLKHLRDMAKSKGYDVGYDGYIQNDIVSREEQEHILKLYEEKEKSADRIFKIQARIHGMSEKAYRMNIGDSFSPLDSSEKNNVYESRLAKYTSDLSNQGTSEKNTVNKMAGYIQEELERREKIKEQTVQIRQQEELVTKEKEKQASLSERAQKGNISRQYNSQIKEQESIISNELNELEELNKKTLDIENNIEQTKKKIEYITLKDSQEDIKTRRKARLDEIKLLKERLKYEEEHLYDIREKKDNESDEEYNKVKQSKIELRQKANLEIQEKINSLQKEHNKELKIERKELAEINNRRTSIKNEFPDVNDNENYSVLLATYEVEKKTNEELINQHKHRLNIAETTKKTLENQKQSALNSIEERKDTEQLIADREKYNNLLKEEALSKKKTAFYSGMSEEQYIASYKVDYELQNINSMQKELDKIEDKNSDAYKEIAENIELAKNRLSEFRKEAYDLGLKFSTKTGRMYNKKDAGMKGVSYTGTDGIDTFSPTSVEQQKKISNALVGITDEAKEAQNEIKALNKVWRTANYTDSQADLVLEISKVNSQLKSKTKKTKEETNALEEQLKVLHEKAKLENIEINKNGYAKTLVSWKDINANPEQYATNKYIKQAIDPSAFVKESSIGSLSNDNKISSASNSGYATENTLQKIYALLSSGKMHVSDTSDSSSLSNNNEPTKSRSEFNSLISRAESDEEKDQYRIQALQSGKYLLNDKKNIVNLSKKNLENEKVVASTKEYIEAQKLAINVEDLFSGKLKESTSALNSKATTAVEAIPDENFNDNEQKINQIVQLVNNLETKVTQAEEKKQEEIKETTNAYDAQSKSIKELQTDYARGNRYKDSSKPETSKKWTDIFNASSEELQNRGYSLTDGKWSIVTQQIEAQGEESKETAQEINQSSNSTIASLDKVENKYETLIALAESYGIAVGKNVDITEKQLKNGNRVYDFKSENGKGSLTIGTDKDGNEFVDMSKMQQLNDGYTKLKKTLGEISKLKGAKIDLLDMSDPAMFGEYADKITEAKIALLELRSIEQNGYNGENIDELVQKIQLVKKVSDELKGSLQVGESEVIGNIDTSNLNNVRQQLESLAHSTSKGSVEISKMSKNNTELTYTVRTADNMLQTYTISMNKYNGTLTKTLVSEEKYLTGFQKMISGFGHKISELWKYTIASFSIHEVIQFFKQGIQVVKDMDAAMTELRKVSNDTEEALESFRKESYAIAKDVASTGKEIVNSAADWARLGYSIEEAAELARNTAIYSNVGDMDIDTATEHMISSIKAWESEFNSEVEASTAIVDRYNEIGNNFAISSAEIGVAMERSSAALKAGGNDLNESLGLLVAGNLIQQDAETTASALKILSLRVRGAKADLEEMGESTDGLADSTSKMQEEIKALTGVDIMLDEDTFKSTAQIIKEIGAVYNQLTDVSQAALLEKIAGKNRASTIEGLLQNYQLIDEVIASAENASGSAIKENEKYKESIQGHLDELTNKWQEVWDSAIDEGVINFFIDLGTSVLELVDNFGLLQSIIGTVAIGLGFKSLKKDGRLKKSSLIFM